MSALTLGNAGWIKLAARNKRIRCIVCGKGLTSATLMAAHLDAEAALAVRLRAAQDARAMREWQEIARAERERNLERRTQDATLYARSIRTNDRF